MHPDPKTSRPLFRTFAVMAAVAMTLLLFPPGASATGHDFTNYREVPNNACDRDTPQAGFPDRDTAPEVHRRSIDCVAHHDIAEGRAGLYVPGEAVNRGQMASFIARTLEAAGDRALPEDPEDRFGDTEGNPHEHRINQLAEIGVVQGRTEDSYAPHMAVTRAQMASFLVRAVSWNHDQPYTPVGDSPYFLDIDGSAHYDAIRVGYELWLFEGRQPGEYDPNAPVLRAAMATFLTRVLDAIHPNVYQTNNQTYQMSPTEPVVAAAGEPIEVTVFGDRTHYTNGAEAMPGPVRQALHIALFPCDDVTWTDLPATFAGDQIATGIGSSNTGAAYISEVNGQPTGDRAVLLRNVAPEDGRITFTLVPFAEQADCTVAVAFDDRAPADELRLDAGHRPVNPFGFVVASWE